jgi:hypothetical protein
MHRIGEDRTERLRCGASAAPRARDHSPALRLPRLHGWRASAPRAGSRHSRRPADCGTCLRMC